jgi:hypothetical protein
MTGGLKAAFFGCGTSVDSKKGIPLTRTSFYARQTSVPTPDGRLGHDGL